MPRAELRRPTLRRRQAVALLRNLCLALSLVGAMAYGADLLSHDPLPVRPVAATAVAMATAVLAVLAGPRSRVRTVLVLIAGAFVTLALSQGPAAGRAAYVGAALLLAAAVFAVRAWPEGKALLGQSRARALIARQEHYAALIAGELHDEVLQLLALTSRQLDVARASSDPHALKLAAQDAMHRLDDQATVLRSIIATLHPVTLRGLGLAPTVRALAGRVADENGLRVTVAIEGEDEAVVDEGTSLAAYRIVQEALTNVVKHARAERADIALVHSYDRLSITVRDDGVGLSGAAPRAEARGYGMQGMRWRCEAYGGTFLVAAPACGGTVVRATLPLRHRA
ncbi:MULTISPECIES: sensor histidine kinase [unclassified Streptomyces]|uniref:Histidine kinase n=1 Tax=Streptomyces sp. NBC_00060 TaxID=2975636 RepID=A0AAU2H9G6_9ACTN